MLRMKIKIIDLLVKIANGEEIPKKIEFVDSIWEYCKNGSTQDYINDYDKCLMEFVPINKIGLNDEVEIIEEPKKIEKLNDKLRLFSYNNMQKIINELNSTRTTINELIDEINELKGN